MKYSKKRMIPWIFHSHFTREDTGNVRFDEPRDIIPIFSWVASLAFVRQVSTAHERESELFWQFINEIQAFKMSTPTGMSLNLQQRVDVINRHKKEDTATWVKENP